MDSMTMLIVPVLAGLMRCELGEPLTRQEAFG